jgi:nucleoid-associated protein YgaU
VIAWIACAQLVWALGWELAVNLPRAQNGQPARSVPLVPAAVAGGVGRLVAVVFAVGLTVATTATPTLARPPVPAALAEPLAASATVAPDASAAPRAALTCWQVSEHDTLWDIAERALGDGARAPEILELNPAMRSARDLRAGQLLRLPDGAAVPAGNQTQPHAAPEPPAPVSPGIAPGFLPEAIVTIETGDTLWGLSEDRLVTANRQPARPAATVAYLDEVIAANVDTIEDPNLIYAGE